MPSWASSTIRSRMALGSGLPFTNTPPSWFTSPKAGSAKRTHGARERAPAVWDSRLPLGLSPRQKAGQLHPPGTREPGFSQTLLSGAFPNGPKPLRTSRTLPHPHSRGACGHYKQSGETQGRSKCSKASEAGGEIGLDACNWLFLGCSALKSRLLPLEPQRPAWGPAQLDKV